MSETQPAPPTNILALGFYDRGNLGDEMYTVVLRRMFGATITCQCSDDCSLIPEGTDAIIVGGGDVCNRHFMEKVRRLLGAATWYTGPLYLVSVGIPYATSDDLLYLRDYDHVFVRTAADFAAARRVLPPQDVTCFRDMAWSLQRTPRPASSGAPRRIAVTLAQPYFANNPGAAALKAQVEQLLRALAARPGVTVFLIAFNTHQASVHECDTYLNDEMCSRVALDNVVSISDVVDPDAMLALLASMDLLVGMRLHSVIFAMMQRLPYVCLHTTQKLTNVVADVGAQAYSYRLPVDGRYKPVSIDVQAVLHMVEQRLADTAFEWRDPGPPAMDWGLIRGMISRRKRKAVLPREPPVVPFAQAVEHCRTLLKGYTGMSEASLNDWMSGRALTADVIDTEQTSLLETCRMVCYAMTGSTTAGALWGLHENCQQPGFKLDEALRYIYGAHVASKLGAQPAAPRTCTFQPRHLIQLAAADTNEFADTHRAGWPFVISGLVGLCADQSRQSDGLLLLDSYADRTFGWAHDTLLQDGVIPYRRPWVAFVHHTFITSHGPYNCATMFQKPAFVQSLWCCRCLIALTQYLGDQLRAALDEAGFPQVGVEVLAHPTEPAPAESRWSPQTFMANSDKKLVQIGSWYRSSYAMYKMPFIDGDIDLQRCILKAKEATNYLKPRCVEDALMKMQEEGGQLKDKSLPHSVNFYVKELIESIREQEAAVTLLERLSNEEYDALLTENVAFLRLVDASACNTILECIVRCCPIIVNRSDPAAEYLGKSYPGMYTTLSEAAAIIASKAKIMECHEYLKKLDKSKLSLETFMEGVQCVLDKHNC